MFKFGFHFHLIQFSFCSFCHSRHNLQHLPCSVYHIRGMDKRWRQSKSIMWLLQCLLQLQLLHVNVATWCCCPWCWTRMCSSSTSPSLLVSMAVRISTTTQTCLHNSESCGYCMCMQPLTVFFLLQCRRLQLQRCANKQKHGLFVKHSLLDKQRLVGMDEICTEWHLWRQLLMPTAPVNLFQQRIKLIWKPAISITQFSVQHVSLCVICVRNTFRVFLFLIFFPFSICT